MALVIQSDGLAEKFITTIEALGGRAPAYLDDFTMLAAFSFRKLRRDYAGAACRVREVTTNSEGDVAFDGYGVSLASIVTITAAGTSGRSVGATMSLSAFAAGADVRIRQMWDQVTAGAKWIPQYDDPTYQPLLLSAGAFTTQNGRPIIPFAAGTQSLRRTLTTAQPWCGVVAGQVPAAGGNPQIMSAKKVGASLPAGIYQIASASNHGVSVDGAAWAQDNGTVSDIGKWRVYAGKFVDAASQAWVDGTKVGEAATGSGAAQAEDFRVACTWNNFSYACPVGEAFVLPGSTDLAAFSKRLMAYWGTL